jgi:hypothetical protein
VILGVEVTNAGGDGEELPPMLDQLKERYGRVPPEALVDGGFATKKAETERSSVKRGQNRKICSRSALGCLRIAIDRRP